MKKYLVEHALFSIYCLVLIILGICIIGSIFDSPTLGEDAYYQLLMISLFFLLLGGPILLLILIVIFIEVKESIKRNKQKTKRKSSENKKMKIFMKCRIVLFVYFMVLITSFTLVYSGIMMMIDFVQDRAYLKNPETIELYNWKIESTGTLYKSSIGLTYRVVGVDRNNKKFNFRIGKSSSFMSDLLEQEKIIIYYLPNTKVVIKIK